MSGSRIRTILEHKQTVIKVKAYDVDGNLINTRYEPYESNSSNYYSTSFKVNYSPDGIHIVSASSDKTIKIWNCDTGVLIRKLEGHSETVVSACYSPDKKYIVSASSDKTIKIWDSESGAILHTIEGHSREVEGANFSPDGKYIVSFSWYEIKIWDSENGDLVRTIEGHSDKIESASYSLDGKYIVSASWDGTIKIWDSKTGEIIKTIYNIAITEILGADLKNIRHDDLSENDLLVLAQNGAIIKGVEQSC